MHNPLFLEVDRNGKSALINVSAIVSVSPSRTVGSEDECVVVFGMDKTATVRHRYEEIYKLINEIADIRSAL